MKDYFKYQNYYLGENTGKGSNWKNAVITRKKDSEPKLENNGTVDI